ncbi:hypothetical protein FQZ97_426050 [compost metagenome]
MPDNRAGTEDAEGVSAHTPDQPRTDATPSIGFSPLHPDEPNGLIGYRSDATPEDLLDAATIRQNAAIGLLHALSDAPHLNELCRGTLSQCIEAVLILCTDAKALQAGAYESMQRQSRWT